MIEEGVGFGTMIVLKNYCAVEAVVAAVGSGKVKAIITGNVALDGVGGQTKGLNRRGKDGGFGVDLIEVDRNLRTRNTLTGSNGGAAGFNRAIVKS